VACREACTGGVCEYSHGVGNSTRISCGGQPMGFKQTDTHRYGKGSYHQIGLVRGQFGNVPMDKWVKFVQEAGFDGWEEASWELDLDKCGTDAGAEAYARERALLAKQLGLEIFTVAVHLQGQARG